MSVWGRDKDVGVIQTTCRERHHCPLRSLQRLLPTYGSRSHVPIHTSVPSRLEVLIVKAKTLSSDLSDGDFTIFLVHLGRQLEQWQPSTSTSHLYVDVLLFVPWSSALNDKYDTKKMIESRCLNSDDAAMSVSFCTSLKF